MSHEKRKRIRTRPIDTGRPAQRDLLSDADDCDVLSDNIKALLLFDAFCQRR